jgi:hypothetical protein
MHNPRDLQLIRTYSDVMNIILLDSLRNVTTKYHDGMLDSVCAIVQV